MTREEDTRGHTGKVRKRKYNKKERAEATEKRSKKMKKQTQQKAGNGRKEEMDTESNQRT